MRSASPGAASDCGTLIPRRCLGVNTKDGESQERITGAAVPGSSQEIGVEPTVPQHWRVFKPAGVLACLALPCEPKLVLRGAKEPNEPNLHHLGQSGNSRLPMPCVASAQGRDALPEHHAFGARGAMPRKPHAKTCSEQNCPRSGFSIPSAPIETSPFRIGGTRHPCSPAGLHLAFTRWR